MTKPSLLLPESTAYLNVATEHWCRLIFGSYKLKIQSLMKSIVSMSVKTDSLYWVDIHQSLVHFSIRKATHLLDWKINWSMSTQYNKLALGWSPITMMLEKMLSTFWKNKEQLNKQRPNKNNRKFFRVTNTSRRIKTTSRIRGVNNQGKDSLTTEEDKH